MANPTSIDRLPSVLEVTTTEAEVTLNHKRWHSVKHDGENAAGTSDTNMVYLAFSAAVDADASEGEDKYKLGSGQELLIPSGFTTLKFKSGAGAPTLSVMPGPDNVRGI